VKGETEKDIKKIVEIEALGEGLAALHTFSEHSMLNAVQHPHRTGFLATLGMTRSLLSC